ncbi:hypothetical protein D9M73_173260 [compost metagenome]
MNLFDWDFTLQILPQLLQASLKTIGITLVAFALAVVLDADGAKAGLGHAGRRAGLGVGQSGGAVQARGAPEQLLELSVLALQAAELHGLEQRQAPGDDGEADQQPDDCVFDGFQG